MTKKQANEILPSEPTQSEIDPSNLVILIIATPKWGKTAFFMSNPDACLLAFEHGHKFQRGYKLAIDCWDQKRGRYEIKKDREGVPHCTAMQAVEILKATNRFNFVIIDTVDRAAQMSADYFTALANVDDPGDMGDFGKGWNKAITKPMRKLISEIASTGRGVGLITHSKTVIERFTNGERARREASIGGKLRDFCEATADVIMHGEMGMKRKGNRLRDRILVCEGDMDTLAGNRSGIMLPGRYVVKHGKQWEQFHRFFTDPEAADKAESFCRKVSKRR